MDMNANQVEAIVKQVLSSLSAGNVTAGSSASAGSVICAVIPMGCAPLAARSLTADATA